MNSQILRNGKGINEPQDLKLARYVTMIGPGYSIRQAASESGFNFMKLQRAAARYKSGQSIIVERGRPPAIPRVVTENIANQGKFRDMLKNSFDADAFQEEAALQMQQINENNPNTPVRLVTIKASTKTMKRSLQRALPVSCDVPTVQNQRRLDAACDANNAVSAAATWPAVISGDIVDMGKVVGTSGDINPDLLFNVDSTTLRLGFERKIKVHLAQGSKEALASRNLSVGYTKRRELPHQPRTAHTLAVTSAGGSLVCTVVKIKDNKVKKVIIVPIQLHELYLMIVPCAYDQDEVAKQLFDECIIPSMCEHRTNVFKKRPVTTAASQDESWVPLTANDLRMVLTLDGEIPQINHILAEYASNDFNMEVYKFCAACSPSQQPNDKMKSFPIMKRQERELRDATTDEIPDPSWFRVIVEKLERHKYFQPASQRTILRFLRVLPTILSKAYTKPIIQDGWIVTGLFPYQPIKMLEHWPFYGQLTKAESKSLLNKIVELSSLAKEQGMLTEEQIEESTGAIVQSATDRVLSNLPSLKQLSKKIKSAEESSDDEDDDEDDEHLERADELEEAEVPATQAAVKGRQSAKKHLNDKPVSYQRAVWLNNAKFVESFKLKKAKAADELLAKQAEKLRREAARVQKAAEKDAAVQRKATKAAMKEQKQQQNVATAPVATILSTSNAASSDQVTHTNVSVKRVSRKRKIVDV